MNKELAVSEYLRREMPANRVDATKCVDVAHVRLPWWPPRATDAEKERMRVLHRWFDTFAQAFLRSDGQWQRIARLDQVSDRLSEGSWVLIFQGSGGSTPSLAASIGTDAADISTLRQKLGAEVLVASWPDDLEWMVSASTKALHA